MGAKKTSPVAASKRPAPGGAGAVNEKPEELAWMVSADNRTPARS